MDLYQAMRTTPSCRYFEPDPVDPAILNRIFDHARFASSGGNRQGWRVVAVTDAGLKSSIGELHRRQWSQYVDHAREGVVGYQGDGSGALMEHGTDYAKKRLDRTDDFSSRLEDVPVLLVFYTDLSTLAITDKDLERPSIVGGGSIYTFVQNVLLACTSEGLGSALTTLLCAEQPEVDELLGVEEGMALAALVAVGWPVKEKQYTKLSRKPVTDFAYENRWANPWTHGD